LRTSFLELILLLELTKNESFVLNPTTIEKRGCKDFSKRENKTDGKLSKPLLKKVVSFLLKMKMKLGTFLKENRTRVVV
jgi:hypothetical protein